MPVKKADKSFLTLGHTAGYNPTDSAIGYFSEIVGSVLENTPLYRKVQLPIPCKIIGASHYENTGAATSNEDWSLYIRKNNTTDYLIATVANTDAFKWWTNMNLNISLLPTDFFEMKFVNPIWVTNPITCKGLTQLIISFG
jgi:hypothetical protein